jgi:hypothetical protein
MRGILPCKSIPGVSASFDGTCPKECTQGFGRSSKINNKKTIYKCIAPNLIVKVQ